MCMSYLYTNWAFFQTFEIIKNLIMYRQVISWSPFQQKIVSVVSTHSSFQRHNNLPSLLDPFSFWDLAPSRLGLLVGRNKRDLPPSFAIMVEGPSSKILQGVKQLKKQCYRGNTSPNFRVCARRIVPVKRFKICHILYI